VDFKIQKGEKDLARFLNLLKPFEFEHRDHI